MVLAPFPASLQVRTAAGDAVRRVFQARVTATLAARGADTIVVDADATTFEASFSPYEYDVRAGQAPAAVAGMGTGLVVQIDAPRHVRRVAVTNAGASTVVQLYRMDGATIASAPTTTAAPGAFFPSFPNDFTDRRFAIRIVSNPTGAAVTEVRVRSYPTGPRLGILYPAATGGEERVVFFWQAPGEIGKAIPAEQGAVRAAGSALAVELQRYLDGLPRPLPETVPVTFVAESDQECELQVAACQVVFHLVSQSFASSLAAEAKTTLRFGDEGSPASQVTVAVPASASIRSARMTTVERLRGEREAAGEEAPVQAGPPDQDVGVRLTPGTAVAGRIGVAVDVAAHAIALGLVALVERTTLGVELQEDWQGAPSGRLLAEGSIDLGAPGDRVLATTRFRELALAADKAYWVVVTPAAGGAVWLARPVVDDAVRILVLDGPVASPEAATSAIKGLEPVARLFLTANGAAVAADPPRLPLTVSAGGIASTTPPDIDGVRTFDLGAAFQSLVENAAAGTDELEVAVTVASAVPGNVIVYPPRIEYDLAT